MEFDQTTISSIFSFFMKVTAAVSVICVSKLYKIVSCIEEDKNQKYYLTYYKISELESYIEALQNDVVHMKEMCVHLEDNLAAQKLLLHNSYRALPQEDIVIEGEIDNSNVVVNIVEPLNTIKEETVHPEGDEEKEKEQEYEHVINVTPVDVEPKYILWKGIY